MKNLKLFDAAYLKLTAWYVAIIMAISLLFSVWLYNQASHELKFGFDRIVEVKPFGDGDFGAIVRERLDDSRQRLIGKLILFNAFVLAGAAGASYLLAQRTMRPIEESVEAQERFTADASHELRTPLAAMKTEIEVGLRDKKLTKDEAVALLQSNLEEVDRLGNLAEGLLTLTQTDAPLDLTPITLHEVAARATKRLQPLADAKSIQIEHQLAPVTAQADAAALDKIADILLDNAIKYSSAGTTVTLKTYAKDGHAVLEVRDQGIGIKATELPHIFDRFYRADTSRTKIHVPGHGLGLSIAQKLAENLGGKITAASTPGKGSSFALTVKAAQNS